MIALPNDYSLIAWFVLPANSTAYVAFEGRRVNCHNLHHTANNNVEQTGGKA